LGRHRGQAGPRRPPDRPGAGIGPGRCAQALAHRLSGEVIVKFHDPQVAIGRTVRAAEVGRDHADQAAGVVDLRRGLHRAESGGGGNVPVPREARVGVDIDDHDLRALLSRPSARGSVIVNHSEVLEEFRAESGMGDDLQ
jgi:hypothetical protein